MFRANNFTPSGLFDLDLKHRNQYVNTQVYCRKIYLEMIVAWPQSGVFRSKFVNRIRLPYIIYHIPSIIPPRQQDVNTQVYSIKQVFCIQPSNPRDKEPSSIWVELKIPNPNCTPLSQRPLPQGLIFRTRLGSPGENSVL